MTLSPLDHFLEHVAAKLPEVLCDKDLISNVPEMFKSASALSRLRTNKQAPSYFQIGPNCVRYLRADVLSWMKNRYQESTYKLESE